MVSCGPETMICKDMQYIAHGVHGVVLVPALHTHRQTQRTADVAGVGEGEGPPVLFLSSPYGHGFYKRTIC